MNIIIIDNYDSFVYNIAQHVGSLGVQCEVVRNDAIGVGEICRYDGVIISPGPGTPSDSRYFGVCHDIIRELGPSVPILGICLGHEGIIDAYGGTVTNAGCVRHGKTSPIIHDNTGILRDIPSPFQATRYHSLVGGRDDVPDCLIINATADDDGEIMGVQHRTHPVTGVQFHPESIMTQYGREILGNFLEDVRR